MALNPSRCEFYENDFVSGFLEKNRDTFSQDAMNLLQTSKFKYLLTLFKGDFSMVKEFTVHLFCLKGFSYTT